VLLLDNGSDDGTAAWVRREHPWVRLVESPVNTGFCAGNNRLVREAEGDAVAFLNNDTRPAPGWLAALVAALRRAPDDVAAVSGKILDWEGRRLDFGRGVMTFDGHAFQLDFGRPLERARLPADGEELLFPCGGNMLVKRASFEAAGGFDEDYFAYLEDVDLGWRLWSGGERVLFAAAAEVRHRSAATSALLGLFHRGFLFERNAFLTAYKNYEDGLWERMMPAVLWTLTCRTQTLLVQNNPGAGTFTLDPYAGWIANTARPREETFPAAPARDQAPPPPAGPRTWPEKWRAYGPLGFFRRAAAKAWRSLGAKLGLRRPEPPRVTDERTVAQLRAITWLLAHLDAAAGKRALIQRRRKRSDAEIFRRFPAFLVPTYPGDERLFASDAFRAWLPDNLPVERARLEEVMAWADGAEDDEEGTR
jgi:GT2 family glycosyltransferase